MMKSFLKADYKRNQVDWVLWKTFTQSVKLEDQETGYRIEGEENLPSRIHVSDEPPLRFSNKIKRLVDLDTADGMGTGIYFSAATTGLGSERRFSLFGIFLLGLSLEFLNAGFNQQEVFFLIKESRNSLLKAFEKYILGLPPSSSQLYLSKEYPSYPKHKDGPHVYADTRVFLVLQKQELYDLLDGGDVQATPRIYGPIVHLGLQSLTEFIDSDYGRYSYHFVIEISQHGTFIRDNIGNAPIIKRGAKSQTEVQS